MEPTNIGLLLGAALMIFRAYRSGNIRGLLSDIGKLFIFLSAVDIVILIPVGVIQNADITYRILSNYLFIFPAVF